MLYQLIEKLVTYNYEEGGDEEEDVQRVVLAL